MINLLRKSGMRKGKGSFSDFMRPLAWLRWVLQSAPQFHFLASCFPRSQITGPQAS
jgi:hypothetical protein